MLEAIPADERLEERRECAARIDHNGVVEWHPMAIYKSTCPVKIKYFPYDRQVCQMRFGPWTYDSARVNITYYEEQRFNLKDYVASPEWNLLTTDVVMRQRAYPCCAEVFSDMIFFMTIERQPAYYNYILILPCFLLSSLTLVLFWLPPETPAKMVLGMNIFVAFFLLLLLLQDSIPSASSSFPLIGNYYCINMTLVTLSTFLCLIVVNLHFRGDSRTEIPQWLRKLAIQHGARLLFVNVRPPGGKNPKSPDKKGSKGSNQLANLVPRPEEVIQMYRQKYGFYPGMPYGEALFPNATQQHMMSSGDRFFPPNFPGDNRLRSYPGQRYTAGPEGGSVFSPMGEGEFPPSYYYGAAGHPYNRMQDPRMTDLSVEDKSKACAFCPACAGLAAAAAAGQGLPDQGANISGEMDPVAGGQYPMNQYTEDPTDELAAVWAAAVTGTAPGRGKRSTTESRAQRDADIDGISAVRDRSMEPDLEAFLLHCIRPTEAKKANMAANTRWTGENRPNMPNSPFYQFSSPHCEDDPEDADDESLQRWPTTGSGSKSKRNAERVGDEEEDDEENPEIESSGLWQRGSRGPYDPSAKRYSVGSDPEFLRRVQAVKRDVSEIVRGIRFMQRQNENKEKANKLTAEWRLVGMVLDRLFFAIYLLALGISILLYFPRSGDEKDD
ncbi:unnamed protein product [Echinostoma caproni]|uniref:Neur_chan_LBD domain-containing protein n=1 Tax=Echinostoma caproni TaxID=27848 RepID=A0A183A542_9TREM|nr:unnamed protein product [Echinostoma caproni]